MKVLILALLLVSTSAFAGRLDCLEDARFTMSVNPDGTYNSEDDLGDIYLGSYEHGPGNFFYLFIISSKKDVLWATYGRGVTLSLDFDNYLSYFNLIGSTCLD